MPRHHHSRSMEGAGLDIDAVVAALNAGPEAGWLQEKPKSLVHSGAIHRSAQSLVVGVRPGNWIARTLDNTKELAAWLQEDDRSSDIVISEDKLVVATFVRGGSYFTDEKDTALLEFARLRRPKLMKPIERGVVNVKSQPIHPNLGREIVVVFDESTRMCLERDSLALAEAYGEASKPQSLQVTIGTVATNAEAQEFIADIADVVPATVRLSESRVTRVR